MKIKVTSVEAIEKFKLHLIFNDGTSGIYDLGNDAAEGVFAFWNEADNFYKVFINPENNAIAWNENIEIDTLNAYLHVKGISYDEYRKASQKNIHAFS